MLERGCPPDRIAQSITTALPALNLLDDTNTPLFPETCRPSSQPEGYTLLCIRTLCSSRPNRHAPYIASPFMCTPDSPLWHEAKLSTEARTIVYRGFQEGYGCDPYILSAKNRHHRRILAQFRTGSHWLNIETGRYMATAKNDRKCPMCTSVHVPNTTRDQDRPQQQGHHRHHQPS